MLPVVVALASLLGLAAPAAAEVGVTLRGSPASMARQHQVARAQDYTFLRTPAQVRTFVDRGYLVPVEGNEDYEIANFVSFPVARPEMRLFIERLAAQHRQACGEKLVVTSLTRPKADQPRNSHPLSVHPAGMAVDLRVLDSAACRSWLESTLLSLEEQDLLDVTRERRPPHYHVAIFPAEYRAHAEELMAQEAALAAEQRAREAEQAAALLAAAAQANAASALVEADAPRRREPAEPWLALAALPVLGGVLVAGAWRRRRGNRSR